VNQNGHTKTGAGKVIDPNPKVAIANDKITDAKKGRTNANVVLVILSYPATKAVVEKTVRDKITDMKKRAADPILVISDNPGCRCEDNSGQDHGREEES